LTDKKAQLIKLHVGVRQLAARASERGIYSGSPPTHTGTHLEKGAFMPSYLLQAAYSTEALAAMVKKPQNRTEAVRKAIEKLGGSLESIWLSFGDYDVVAILEMPDNASAAGFALAIAAGGACRSVKTTPLLSADEGMTAMKKAGNSGYKSVTVAK
jgi:uncharacterized protein with GYD domain